LEQVMQDGTKIRALASTRSYQREGTIQGIWIGRGSALRNGRSTERRGQPKAKQAQARARREQQERLESALEELQKLQERKSGEKPRATRGEHERSASASDAPLRWGIIAELQRADFH